MLTFPLHGWHSRPFGANSYQENVADFYSFVTELFGLCNVQGVIALFEASIQIKMGRAASRSND